MAPARPRLRPTYISAESRGTRSAKRPRKYLNCPRGRPRRLTHPGSQPPAKSFQSRRGAPGRRCSRRRRLRSRILSLRQPRLSPPVSPLHSRPKGAWLIPGIHALQMPPRTARLRMTTPRTLGNGMGPAPPGPRLVIRQLRHRLSYVLPGPPNLRRYGKMGMPSRNRYASAGMPSRPSINEALPCPALPKTWPRRTPLLSRAPSSRSDWQSRQGTVRWSPHPKDRRLLPVTFPPTVNPAPRSQDPPIQGPGPVSRHCPRPAIASCWKPPTICGRGRWSCGWNPRNWAACG